jgi:hypothetical protein
LQINYAKEPNEAKKNNLKEEILEVINENFIEMILEYGQPKCTRDTQEIPDNKNREFEKAQKQIKETIESLCLYSDSINTKVKHRTR